MSWKINDAIDEMEMEAVQEIFDRSASFEIFKRLVQEEMDIPAGKAIKYYEQFENELNETL